MKKKMFMYKDKIYVSDFVERLKHQANIWGKDDAYEEVVQTNKEIAYMLIGLFILIVGGIMLLIYFSKS